MLQPLLTVRVCARELEMIPTPYWRRSASCSGEWFLASCWSCSCQSRGCLLRKHESNGLFQDRAHGRKYPHWKKYLKNKLKRRLRVWNSRAVYGMFEFADDEAQVALQPMTSHCCAWRFNKTYCIRGAQV